MTKYKVLKLSDPTDSQIEVIKKIIGKPYNDYHFRLLNNESIRKQLTFLDAAGISIHNRVSLNRWNDKPLNPQCYYKDLNYEEFLSILIANTINN